MRRYTDNHYCVQHTLPLIHRRWLLRALGGLEHLGRDLRSIHRNPGEARLMHPIALHDQRIVGVLQRLAYLVPLLLLYEDRIRRRRSRERR